MALQLVFWPMRCKRQFCVGFLGGTVKAALAPFCFPLLYLSSSFPPSSVLLSRNEVTFTEDGSHKLG